MSGYIPSIAGLISWPLVILVSYLFIRLNLKHFTKLEKLEKYEQKYGK